MNRQILIVDDEPTIVNLVVNWFEPLGFKVHGAGTGAACLKVFSKHAIDLAILDYSLPDTTGGDLFRVLRGKRKDLPVIFITARPNLENAVELMREGACDYVVKPVAMANLEMRVRQILELHAQQVELSYHREKTRKITLHFWQGNSTAMRAVAEQVDNVARYPQTTVLITGPTGAGKEVIARRIHELTCGENAPFVEIDCSAIPRELAESELFGHEKGAFTGAHRNKPGLFEAAGDGTVFLDEIGELELTLQAKLLRVLESRVFKRVGGHVPLRMGARVIAATNRSLEEMVAQKTFREDLFYRLNVIRLALPPLKDRGEDVIALAHHFLEHFSHTHGKRVAEFTPEVLDFFRYYHFPGNVRELRNLIERGVLHTKSDSFTLSAMLLPPEVTTYLDRVRPETPSQPAAMASSPTIAPVAKVDGAGLTTIRDAERKLLLQALQTAKGNKTKAAEIAGLSRTALFRRLKKYGLSLEA